MVFDMTVEDKTLIMLVIAVILFLGFIIVGSYVAIKHEKRYFNSGTCPKCGKKLWLVDYDSQGGRFYYCRNCGYETWVSYNRIDKSYFDKETKK